MNAEYLHKLLSKYRFTLSHEKALQAEISALLTDNKIEHSREVKLSDRDCIDFLVGSTGMEVKLKGSAMAIYKQCERFNMRFTGSATTSCRDIAGRAAIDGMG